MSNAPGTVAGYGNLADYLPDDQLPDFLEVDEHRYEYGKPLIKDEKSLTTTMEDSIIGTWKPAESLRVRMLCICILKRSKISLQMIC